MKLKYNFVTREIDGVNVAVAVGKDNEKFNGMIKLNESGVFIFQKLCEGNVSEGDVVNALMEKYDVTEEKALQTVKSFIDQLRKSDLIIE